MPQFDPAFFASEVFWSLIAFGVLFLLLKRLVLPKVTAILDERTRLIQAEIDEAKRQRSEAEALKQQHADKLDAIDEEAKAMFDAADRKIRAHRDQLMGEWKAEVERKKRELHDDAELARQHAIRDIRKEAAAMVVEATEKMIHQHVDAAEAETLLEDAIEELGKQGAEKPAKTNQ